MGQLLIIMRMPPWCFKPLSVFKGKCIVSSPPLVPMIFICLSFVLFIESKLAFLEQGNGKVTQALFTSLCPEYPLVLKLLGVCKYNLFLLDRCLVL